MEQKENEPKVIQWINQHIEEPLDNNKIIEKFSKWFDTNKKMAFLITFLVGIITHITFITSTIMSQDGLWNSMKYSRPGDFETTLGRWGIGIIQRFNFFVAVPTVSTISCIVVMAITSVFLIDVFQMKNKFSIIITALFLAVTPTLTVTLLYVYTAFAYCCNMLISTLVIWFIYQYKHKKIGIIFSILLFALSLSIYQSYIGVSIGLCLIITILELVKCQKTIKEILLDVLKTMVVVIVGGLLYYIITNILLRLKGLSLSTYKDMDTFNIANILLNLNTTIPNCYHDFINFFVKDNIIFNTNYRRYTAYIILFILFGIFTVVSAMQIKQEEKKEKYVRIFLILFLTLLLPIALNFIDILVNDSIMYALTSAQMILVIPMIFALSENIYHFNLIKGISILVCFYIIGTYYVADNASYADMKMRFNQAQAVSVRILDRMENTEGYVKNMPICMIGIIGDNNYPKVGNLYQFSVGSVFLNPVFHGSYEGSIGTMSEFLKIYLGEEVEFCDAETYEKIVKSDEVKELNDFPEKDCTAIIHGVMVIKLSNYIPLPDGTLLYQEY